MGTHPLNLAFRFVLELSALVCVGAYGWTGFDGPTRWMTAVGFPLVFMMLWGVFAVPKDPSRSGGAPWPVSGTARLALELTLFASAVAALSLVQRPLLAAGLGVSVFVHYALSWDRITWLMSQRRNANDVEP